MAPIGPPPPRRFQQPFDPVDWAARNPTRIFLLAWIAAGVILLVWGVLSSFYTVQANEEAVVLRFGEYHTTTGPGFHGKLPFGIDKVRKGEVKAVHVEEFGYRTIQSGVRSQLDYASRKAVAEATMLTGDLNLVLVSWAVRYKIKDLESYLFKVRNPVVTLRDVSLAVMRIEVGDRSVDEVLTLDRPAIMSSVAEEMQAALDRFECGIHIVKVNLKRVEPPAAVKDAFNKVNQARQLRKQIINQAEGERNQKIPAARGEKERIIKEAEGYMIGRINRAEGDTKAFLSVLAEYLKAEDVTRQRLYLETMERLLPRLGQITLIDSDDTGVLKLLDIGDRKGN